MATKKIAIVYFQNRLLVLQTATLKVILNLDYSKKSGSSIHKDLGERLIFTTQLDAVTNILGIQFACRSVVILNSNTFNQQYILVFDMLGRRYLSESIAVLQAQGSGLASILGFNPVNYTLTGFAAGQLEEGKEDRISSTAARREGKKRKNMDIEQDDEDCEVIPLSTELKQSIVICISLTPTGASHSPSRVVVIKKEINLPTFTRIDSTEFPSIIKCMYFYRALKPLFLLLSKSGSLISYFPGTDSTTQSIATKSSQ